MNGEEPLHIRCRYGPSPGFSLLFAGVFTFGAWIFARAAQGLRPIDGNGRLDRMLRMFPEDLQPWVAGLLAIVTILLALWMLSLQWEAISGKSYVEMTEAAITLSYQRKKTTIPFNEVETIEKRNVAVKNGFDPGLVIQSRSRERLEIISSLMPDQGKFETLARAILQHWETVKADRTNAQ